MAGTGRFISTSKRELKALTAGRQMPGEFDGLILAESVGRAVNY